MERLSFAELAAAIAPQAHALAALIDSYSTPHHLFATLVDRTVLLAAAPTTLPALVASLTLIYPTAHVSLAIKAASLAMLPQQPAPVAHQVKHSLLDSAIVLAPRTVLLAMELLV